MKAYPVHVYRPSYTGRDPRRRAKHLEKLRIADRVEKHLNRHLESLPNNSVQVYLNYQVARDIQEDGTIVAEIINGTDGGSNGITIVKGSFAKAMANAGRPPDLWDES